MNEQIRQIAERLRGLRDALDLSAEETAAACHIPVETYLQYESGESDIPMNFLCNAAATFGVEPSALIAGNEPTMSNYWLTRKGKGETVERQKAYKYQALAMGFKHAKAAPFIVTVEPKEGKDIFLNSHPGQEFNMVLEGELMLSIGGKELYLHEGDSIYFDAAQPHGMLAMGGKPVKFFAIIL
ncbi:MAG: helix-turn-helix transcriptional regulator [Bacteroidales bacterium]|nr:helix-turn-helix transcriptional regulator [Bacteroidales bacterium]